MLPAPTVPGGLQSMTGMSMSHSWAKDWLNRLHAQARSALALLAACLALTASGASAAPIITVAGTYSLGQFRTQIPGLAVKPPLMEYYLQAVDKGGLPIASRGDVTAPLRVVVNAPGGVLKSPFFWVPVGVAVVGGAVAAAILLTRSTTAEKSSSTVTISIKE